MNPEFANDDSQMKTASPILVSNDVRNNESKLKHAPRSLIEEQLSAHSAAGIFSIQKQNTAVKQLNAKKIDINFDGDDFFNSFEPTKHKTEINEKPNKFLTPLHQNDAPSSLLSSTQDLSTHKSHSLGSQNSFSTSSGSSDDNGAQEKLRQMGNRKGISSEELFGNRFEKSDEVKSKY